MDVAPIRVLFLTKKGQIYAKHYTGEYVLSSGLRNSAQFVVDALNANGLDAKLVQVIDNNDIDREVSKYKPSHVMIEALWVVPEKFTVLNRLHPTVQWVIRLHSEIPFLAQEGMAMDWLFQYLDYAPAPGSGRGNVLLAFNSIRTRDYFRLLLTAKYGSEAAISRIIYLPNCYNVLSVQDLLSKADAGIAVDIGCFGAIRPLKNQLLQAVAAIAFADSRGLKLRFHINSTRIEQKGDPVLNNLVALFKHSNHELIQHEWHAHDDFLAIVQTMDLGLQVSFTETFNIVSADFASVGVPIVVSPEIPWVAPFYRVDHPTSLENIIEKLAFTYDTRTGSPRIINHAMLRHFAAHSEFIWLEYLLGTEVIS
jgi:hypothetical protein